MFSIHYVAIGRNSFSFMATRNCDWYSIYYVLIIAIYKNPTLLRYQRIWELNNQLPTHLASWQYICMCEKFR